MLRKETRQQAAAVPELPQVHPNPADRYRPFELNNIQQAYIIGRSEGVELGSVACQSYDEVDMTDLDVERFEIALQKMIERHEMLRCIVLLRGTPADPPESAS